MNCTEVHLRIGAEPQALPPDLEAHLRECVACADYRRETLALDAQILRALQIDAAVLKPDAVQANSPPGDTEPAPRPSVRLVSSTSPAEPEKLAWPASQGRRWALAASVLLAVAVGFALWVAVPTHTLAADVVAHVISEPLPPVEKPLADAALASVLRNAKLRLDPMSQDILFAQTCFFRGRLVPHFVVRARGAEFTVLVLPDEHVKEPARFDGSGYSGILLPNEGRGSIAVLSRSKLDSEQEAREILSALHSQPAA